MALSNMTIYGANYVKLAPLTPDSGDVTTVGTVQVHDAISEVGVTLANAEAATGGGDTVTATLDQGVTLSIAKLTRTLNVDGATYTVDETGGAGGESSYDAVSFTTYISDPASLETLRGMFGKRVLVAFGLGFDSNNADHGTGYLVGKISGNIERKTAGQQWVAVPITIAGTAITATIDETEINTAFSTAVSPLGGTPSSSSGTITPTALTNGKFTSHILNGLCAMET